MLSEQGIDWVREGDAWPDAEDPDLRGLLLDEGVLRRNHVGRLAIRFVGVIIHNGRTLVALPKVQMATPNVHIHRQAMRAMRRYKDWIPTHHEPSPYLNQSPEKGPVSALAATDWLVRDYLEYGLLRRTDVAHELGGRGVTNWRHTVERVTPVMSHGRPVYLETVTRRTEDNNRNFATRLHRYLLEKLTHDFGGILDMEPINLDHEPVERLDALPSIEECEARIASEQRATYSQRGLDLLAMMLATVNALEIETARGLSLYGTSSFHHVWEEACGRVFGNRREEWTPSLPKPVWTSATGQSAAASTFIPDLVVPLGIAELLIGDAKYYRPSMPPELAGVPGVNDVGKQIWYKQSLQREAGNRGYDRIQNAFLFPSAEVALTSLGWVEMPRGGEAIDCVAIPFLQALAIYSGDLKAAPDVWREQLAGILASNSGSRNARNTEAMD